VGCKFVLMFKALKIAVLLLFLQPQISNTVVWLLYELDKEYITEQFCVNKDKPALKCNGKCHLATQLTTSDPLQSEQPTQINYIPQIQFFFQDVNQPFVEENLSTLAVVNPSFFYSFEPFVKLDRPPQA